MLCFDKGTNQFFIASEEQVKIVENQMNNILKRMISEGKEIITLRDFMYALGVENLYQNNDDQKERSDCEMAKYQEITMAEFLEATRTNDDCWIFMDNGPNCRFSKRIPDPDDDDQEIIYCFDDGKDLIHRFKEMEGDIWHADREWSTQAINCWSTWRPWTGRE